jgi:cytochrome c oxidase subunit 1
MNMLIFFILFFEMAVLYFASAVLLNSRVATPKLAWTSFALMVVGTLIIEWTMFTGKADVLFTSYVPLKASPWYYLGVIFFAVGALVVTCIFFATLVVAKREKTYQGSVPLVTFGAACAGSARWTPRSTASCGGDWGTRHSRSTSPPWCRSGTCWVRSPSARS